MKKLTFYLIPFLFITALNASEKVLIITHSYNRPDFIEIQHKTFKAFLKEEYEFVVFNDAPGDEMCRTIENTCHQLGIRCIRIPQHMHKEQSPNWRHADGIRYSLELEGFNHDGYVAIIDSDMFLIRPFSIAEYLQGYDMSGCLQERGSHVKYIWPGLAFMHMSNLPNKTSICFDCGKADGESVDVGGLTHYYIKNNPSVRVKFYTAQGTDHLPRSKDQLQPNTDPFIVQWLDLIPRSMELHADNNFLHYYAGSNWPGQPADYLKKKTAILNNFITSIIAAHSK